MAIQAQFQIPSPYFQNNLLLEDFQPQIVDCASKHQRNLPNYRAPTSNKRVREDDSANSSSFCIYSDILLSNFYNYSLKIDVVIHTQVLQNHKLKLALERIRYRQYQDLLSAMGHRVIQILQIKAVEYESLARKNREFEENIRQINEENQIWCNVIKDNESKAASLKATLDKVIQQNFVQFNDMGAKEGYGDSDETALAADDATSFNYEVEGTGNGTVRNAMEQWLCRTCKGMDISVLVWPCRHLCPCTACESVYDMCPICDIWKKASLQVLLD